MMCDPHPCANVIAADTHRFRVLNCGRRFGKTSLAVEEIKGKALANPNRIAYTSPTYQQARDIAWELLKKELRPIVVSVNEAHAACLRHPAEVAKAPARGVFSHHNPLQALFTQMNEPT